jgi:hypothetical protein
VLPPPQNLRDRKVSAAIMGEAAWRPDFKRRTLRFRKANDSPAQHVRRRLARVVLLARNPVLKPLKPPHHRPHHCPTFAATSSAATRTSTSSISIALAVCPITISAARSRVDAGALVSSMIFNNVDTAAPEACCCQAEKGVVKWTIRESLLSRELPAFPAMEAKIKMQIGSAVVHARSTFPVVFPVG